ncbi:PhzF family phenazine biosynthesis protein [Deinococcus marmoris]|uniref:Phenazine biosynthesis protein PhzF like n=1 Tax=Deinococcus marmoris TaxID=249408 RepID=A0A1U7NR09_9DEIO|nr:PhzF family phenazine biosynthesis isomerase [Deinococcus marmoris]OLV15346.1 Phenazine biosynthesis protein PhzF like [Deinococcus marmoris]
MTSNEFFVVEVFAAAELRGNPVMIVMDDGSLETEQMQRFAAWNGMPETVYLRRGMGGVSQSNAYAARIFSPRTELVFAGHPSLGAAHVAVEAGLVERPVFNPGPEMFGGGDLATLWQRGAVGMVELKLRSISAGNAAVFVKTPAPSAVHPLGAEHAKAVAAALSLTQKIQAYQVSAGANWIVVRRDDPADLERLVPQMSVIEALSAELGVSGVTVYVPADPATGTRFEVRSFGPLIGVPEDAVCGGGTACMAALEHHLDGGQSAGQPSYTDSVCFVQESEQRRSLHSTPGTRFSPACSARITGVFNTL